MNISPTVLSTMRKLLIPAVVTFLCIPIAWGSALAPSTPIPVPASAPLTSVRAIRSLSSTDAGRGVPVAFRATVTHFRGDQKRLFVQDGSIGIFVKASTDANLVPGDRVLVKGTTYWSFRPSVLSSNITRLGHGAMPAPVPAAFDDMIKGRLNATLVTAQGVVQSIDVDRPNPNQEPDTTLRVLMDGGYVDAQIDSADPQLLDKLLDAEVAITGVAGGRFDGKMQLIGIVFRVSSLANIRILKPAAVNPWQIPETPMDEVLGVYHVKNLTSRVRVTGTITYFEPGATVVLQNGHKSIWIKTDSFAPMKIGDRGEATGFPAFSHGFLMLYGSAIRDDGIAAPVSPEPAQWHQLTSGQHIFDLVSIEGQVVMQARETSQDEYILLADGHKFSAFYPHATTVGGPLPMKEIPVGANIRVTGICAMDDSNPFSHDVPFNILLRSPGDLQILSMPSWFTVRHLGILFILLLLATLLIGARAWYADRVMHAQIAALGYIGQRRGLILEDINKMRPLARILESITELASVSLKGAPCWCQVADGAKLGNCPENPSPSGMRIAEHPIASHSGPPLGSIFAAFDSRTVSNAEELKALASAAELSTLAIETSRLHSDLVHRSEFDLLTDIQNRFAFERHLETLTDEARQTAGVFGLIFIDLDGFKQVNDVYGHHVGDLYLQQVAERMKTQLRPSDMLARLGGDEFGLLVPVVHSRSDVEEITSRLKRCFDQPFVVLGFVLHGSASLGIALYPEDATNKDSLLSAADAAMYASKHSRKAKANPPADSSEPYFTILDQA
jgi:diguanylate cyclase (GGDEF)-like protein